MNPPMINSTNSVSTTRKKREAERSVNWTVEETQVLLCAWSDERVQKSLAENLRNRHVFKHLSARMSEMGFSRSPHQCRLRVKTLKANYVRAKLQRSVDSSQPCTFKYFAEMDAVLGRRAVGGAGGNYFVAECHPDSVDRKGGVAQDFNSNTEDTGHHRTGRGGRPTWQLDSNVKLEDGEDSEEAEFEDLGSPQCSRERCHTVYLVSPAHRDLPGPPVANSSRSPSPPAAPFLLPPPPAPSPPPPHASPLPAPPDPSRDSAHLEPVLKHLLDSFQRLVSETRGLLVQLETQRQEQARWHQELLAQWLQREERRQREAAEREERREKARMEHEIRVLELLTGLARDHGCKCGGSQTGSGAATGPSHSTNKDRS